MKKEPKFKLRIYDHDVLRNIGLLETYCFIDLGKRLDSSNRPVFIHYLFRNTEGIHFLEMKNL